VWPYPAGRTTARGCAASRRRHTLPQLWIPERRRSRAVGCSLISRGPDAAAPAAVIAAEPNAAITAVSRYDRAPRLGIDACDVLGTPMIESVSWSSGSSSRKLNSRPGRTGGASPRWLVWSASQSCGGISPWAERSRFVDGLCLGGKIGAQPSASAPPPTRRRWTVTAPGPCLFSEGL
jgi:hypothetical protein